MKKIFTLAAIALFTMTSCSDDSDSDTVTGPGTSPSETVLLKKMIVTDSDGMTETTNYTYNGKKIVSESTNGEYSEYTYEGNNITKLDIRQEGDFRITYTFTYSTNGQLIKHTYTHISPPMGPGQPSSSSTITAHYTYNADGTISYEDFVSFSDGPQNQEHEHGILTFANGNLVNKVVNRPGNQVIIERSAYDTKNSPFKNVTGNNALAIAELVDGPNNIINYTSNTSTPGEPERNYSYSTTYTYNSANFPVTSVETYSDDVYTTQYFYE